MTKHITRMTIDDAEHYTPEQRQAIIDSYPEHEREARTKGIPSLGSGRVFPISEEAILCDPIPIPGHWCQIVGMDFGWEHPFAATRNAWDKDNDVWYVTASYRESKATPPIHYAAIKPWTGGTWRRCSAPATRPARRPPPARIVVGPVTAATLGYEALPTSASGRFC